MNLGRRPLNRLHSIQPARKGLPCFFWRRCELETRDRSKLCNYTPPLPPLLLPGEESALLAGREAGLGRRQDPAHPSQHGHGRAGGEEGGALVAAARATGGSAPPGAAFPGAAG